jgi:hypothetical protein
LKKNRKDYWVKEKVGEDERGSSGEGKGEGRGGGGGLKLEERNGEREE